MNWKFFIRFGGEASAQQKLRDFGRRLPVWAQYPWNVLVEWLIAWATEQRIQAELRDVDKQAEQINQQWTQIEDAERTAAAEAAAARILQANPDATVSVIQTTMGEGSDVAILVEHPPDGSKAQDLIGGAMEIKSPWMTGE